jgi:DNA-binding transcriptional LysR family regulator
MDTVTSDKLRVLLSHGLSHPQLATLLARQRAEEPRVKVQLSESDPSLTSRQFSNGQYDIGISRSAIIDEQWDAVPLWREPWVVATSIHSPLRQSLSVTMDQLIDCPFIQWDPVLCYENYRELNAILESLGNPQPAGTRVVRTFDMMMTLVASGQGVTITPASKVKRYLPWGVLGRFLADVPLTTTVCLIQRSRIDTTSAWWRFSQRALSIDWETNSKLASI